MYAVEKIGSYISTVSGPFHPFGGAVDIIVVEQQDGSFKTSPWYVRFGKFQGVLKMRDKEVKISVNGVEAGFSMYLDGRGEAFFLRADDSVEEGSVVSPPSSGDEMDPKMENDQFEKNRNPAAEGGVSMKSGAVVTRTNSRRSAIFGFMFGGKPVKGEQDSVDRRNSIERAEIAADLLEVKWSTNLSSNDRMSRKNSPERCDQNVSVVDKEPSSEKTLMVDGYNSAEVDDESFTSSFSRNYSEQLRDEDTLLVTVKEEVTVQHTSDAGNLADITSLASDKASKDSVVDNENFSLNQNVSFDDSSISHDEKHDGSHWNGTVGKTLLEEVSSHNEIVEIYSGDKTCSSDIDIIAVETREVDIVHAGSDTYSGNKTEFASEKIDGSISKDSTWDDEGEEIKSVVHSQRIESFSINLHVSSVESSGGVGIPSSRPQCCNTTISEDPSNDTSDYISTLRTQEFKADNSFVSQRLQYSNLKNGSLLHSSATIVSEEVGSAVTSEQTLISLPCSPDQQLLSSESETCCMDRASIEFSQQNEATVEQLDYNRSQPEIEEQATMVVSSFPASLSSAPFSETLDEIQFSFSDCDSFSGKEVESELSNDDKLVEEEDIMLTPLTPSSDTKVDDLNFQNCVQPLEDISDVMQPRSNPVNIPGNGLIPSTLELSARSLPVLRTDIDDIEGLNLHYPLSCSLDANSDTSELDIRKKDKSISSYSLVESGNNVVRTQITPDAFDESMEDGKKITVNANVELSLCKHLLYKGMGADAARQAFDAEKVNLDKFRTLGPSLVKNNKLVVKLGGYYFPWDAAAPFILGMVSFGQEHIFEPQGMIPVEGDEQYRKDNVINTSTTSGGSWSLWPFSLKRSRTTSTKEISTEKANDEAVDSSRSIKNSTVEIVSKKVKMVRSLTPTSKELASLNLKEGRNIVTFSFLTPMLGLQKVDARIYLWKWSTRIVISDVDGTITKSDVLGQFMPLVGVDWSQSGVAHLFCAIKENGYQLLFLSARAISQAHLTRQFLFNLKQDGKALPDGPVVISPDGLVPSLYREVIRRAPHEFKISCLEAIKALFPPDSNPFYAGFGNRDTDEISYLKVGIPLGKIFIINPKGQVAVNRQVDTRSYTSLHELVNGMFPPTTSEQEDYNSWNYWKMPPLEIDL